MYLALGFGLWVHAWTQGATTHTLCGCGDPALFLWFFQWPATALAHGHNPFFSTALFHPGGINLLAQTSVTGLSLPLVPVTWIWGPVASLNVASTIAPALTAFTAFIAIRRWVRWTPTAFLGGLLYGFSPFVLTSLEFAHLMTAALMVLPLILIALDEILLRQRHSAVWSGVLLGLLVFVQFFLSSELLAITALMDSSGSSVLVVAALIADRAALRRLAPHAATGLARRLGRRCGAPGLAGVVRARRARRTSRAWCGPTSASSAASSPRASSRRATRRPTTSSCPQRVRRARRWHRRPISAGASWPSSPRAWWRSGATAACGSSASCSSLCGVCSLGIRRGQWEPARLFDHVPVLENVIQQRFMAIGFLAAAVMLAIVVDHVYGAAARLARCARCAGRCRPSRSCRWGWSSASACPSRCGR